MLEIEDKDHFQNLETLEPQEHNLTQSLEDQKLGFREKHLVNLALRDIAPKNTFDKLRIWGRKAIGAAAVLGVTFTMMPSFKKDLIRERLFSADAQALIDPIPQVAERTSNPRESLNNLAAIYGLGYGLYRDMEGPVSGVASAWHLYQTANAVQIETMLPGPIQPKAKNTLNLIEKSAAEYQDKSPAGFPAGMDPDIHVLPFQNFGRYVDDNLWWGLFWMNQYIRYGNPQFLAHAKQANKLAQSQWDRNGGGIFWKEQLPGETIKEKALVSNAPAVILSAQLYKESCKTKCDPQYLSQAKRTIEWVKAHLFDPQTKLYMDHIRTDGSVDQGICTYGQGVAIRALMELSEIDPKDYPLKQAVDLADRSMDFFKSQDLYGVASYDVIFLRSIMKLAAVYHNPEFSIKVIEAQRLIKDAMPDYPTDLKGASADTGILALNALPYKEWSNL